MKRLACILALSAAAFAQKTITGNVTDIGGTAVPNVGVLVSVQNCSTNIVRSSTGLAVPGAPLALDSSNNFSVVLPDETTLQCGATTPSAFYRFALVQLDSIITTKVLRTLAYSDYDVTGSGTVALKDLTPRNPTPPAVPQAVLENPAGTQVVTQPDAAHPLIVNFLSVANCAGCTSSAISQRSVSGTVNGLNAMFTLPSAPPAGGLLLFENGLMLIPGVGNDYTVTGNTVTFTLAPAIGAALLAYY